MKSERLIALLLALQSGRKQTAPELAAALEVSVRTIYRDVDALSAAGVPVYAERGARGGIALLDTYRDALMGFDEGELRALFVSSDDVLADLGLIGRRGRALAKLERALPRGTRSAVQRGRSRVHIDSRGWHRAPQATEPLEQLREAVWHDHRVEMDYRDRVGNATRRVVDPLGLVSKAGAWYVVARDEGEIKTFRVQRIETLQVREERFERPPDFDVGAHWTQSSAEFAREAAKDAAPCEVTFHVRDRVLGNAMSYLDVVHREPVAGSDPPETLLRVRFPHPHAAVHEALAWADDAILLEPLELRERILDRARAIVERYGTER